MSPEEENRSAAKVSSTRRYTDREVALVIKRAAELQEQQSEQTDRSSSGLSLGELEQVARESGLDPSLVRRAAQDLDIHREPVHKSRFLGAPSVVTVERTVDGELPPGEYEGIVEELRRTFNDNGYVSTLGRSLAWSSSPNGYGRHHSQQQVNVTVNVRNGKTIIRAERSLRGVAGGLFGGLMGGVGGGTTGISMGIGLGVLHSVPAAVGLWGAVLGASYTLARTIYVHVARNRRDELRGVVERIANQIAESTVHRPIGSTEDSV